MPSLRRFVTKERLITLGLVVLLGGLYFGGRQAAMMYHRHNLQHEIMDQNMIILQQWGKSIELQLEDLKKGSK